MNEDDSQLKLGMVQAYWVAQKLVNVTFTSFFMSDLINI